VNAALVDVDCPVCGSSASTHVFDTRDYQFRVDSATFGVRRCSACGCGFLSPRPGRDDLARYYNDAFYWSYEGGQSLGADDIARARAAQIAAKARLLEGLKPGALLDIGTQKGEFLDHMRGRGWDVQGVEFQTLPGNPFDVPIRYGDFLSMDWSGRRFDCITMWAVLEHVYEPRAFVQGVAALLKPGGRFFALVTNFNSIQARCFRQDDFPRHLTLFTHRSLRRLLHDAGMRVLRSTTDQSIFTGTLHGGLVYLAKRALRQPRDEIFAEWRQSDDPLAFCCKWRGRPSAALRWVSRIDYALSRVPERLLDATGNGFILTVEAERMDPDAEPAAT
jgi:2-polyprenyl-3-methyl-5-hydroxy-6-metoxy-1,4-benzoquinol methylase